MAAVVGMLFLLVIQLVLLFFVLRFLFKELVWVISGHLDAPFVPTSLRYAALVGAALDIQPGDVVYELGCGDGRFMLALASLEAEARFVGIERNPALYGAAMVRKWSTGNPKNAEFRLGNLFKADLKKANKVYAYLLDSVMFQLQPKFESEFKGRVASRAFPFPRRQLSNVVELTKRMGAHGQHLLFVYDF